MSAPQWLGLLRWTLNYTDGTEESRFNQMSAEDREWLGQVLKECVRDDAEKMNEIAIFLQERSKDNSINEFKGTLAFIFLLILLIFLNV